MKKLIEVALPLDAINAAAAEISRLAITEARQRQIEFDDHDTT